MIKLVGRNPPSSKNFRLSLVCLGLGRTLLNRVSLQLNRLVAAVVREMLPVGR
jgi:hypothetical protein